MQRVAFVFTRPPHGSAVGREGLDAILAIESLLGPKKLGVFFVALGVLQLLPQQRPEEVLARDYIRTFGLLSLCEIGALFICQDSLVDLGFSPQQPLILEAEPLTSQEIRQKLVEFDAILTF